MALEWALLALYVVGGIGWAGALSVWWSASTEGDVDLIDGTYLVMVALVVIAVWPLVMLGSGVARLLTRMRAD
jgi:hypothetical protein